METRTEKSGQGWDLLADCDATKEQLITAAADLTQNFDGLTGFALYRKDEASEIPWFPRHISDLDYCSHCITKYEPTTDSRHPGHGDAAYIARRKFLNDQAMEYRHGEPIPYVDYTKDEHETWRAVYEKLRDLRESHACSAYRSSGPTPRHRSRFVALMQPSCIKSRLSPSILGTRTTTYLRHGSKPHHSPEPDLIHELLGHVPMFADPMVAQMSQDIGLMSLGATDEQIEKLATVYWFIIEFGLCREDGQLKAIGAGLLSAYGELMHACSDKPEHREFDPATTAVQKYEDSDYQPLYFVAQSIQDALSKLSTWGKHLLVTAWRRAHLSLAMGRDIALQLIRALSWI
ncbi:Biopterin-dependent aromatic amino acid hydroxylase [Teladorsagia circumcincta]|uniref:Biopterin-dependent aromatic amino acid hydroxylase n=1 Tax=Teladorsagia circumcincta TaxID=45464 RepID=A0A2G9UPZ7_TELCI|nr:Biopterin-dependent aromatic amino acid hydroxylase [Teladorsagia circumcincta]